MCVCVLQCAARPPQAHLTLWHLQHLALLHTCGRILSSVREEVTRERLQAAYVRRGDLEERLRRAKESSSSSSSSSAAAPSTREAEEQRTARAAQRVRDCNARLRELSEASAVIARWEGVSDGWCALAALPCALPLHTPAQN